MKITNVEIDIIERDTGDLEVKDERFNIGGKTKQGVLRIKTSEGFEGNSFIGDQAANSLDRIQIINEKIKPLIIGMDSDNREWLWSQVENIAGHGLPIHASWAPIDVALWDLAGKILNKPVYRLLGGRNTQISLYATYPPRHNNSLGFIEEAKDMEVSRSPFSSRNMVFADSSSLCTTCRVSSTRDVAMFPFRCVAGRTSSQERRT